MDYEDYFDDDSGLEDLYGDTSDEDDVSTCMDDLYDDTDGAGKGKKKKPKRSGRKGKGLLIFLVIVVVAAGLLAASFLFGFWKVQSKVKKAEELIDDLAKPESVTAIVTPSQDDASSDTTPGQEDASAVATPQPESMGTTAQQEENTPTASEENIPASPDEIAVEAAGQISDQDAERSAATAKRYIKIISQALIACHSCEDRADAFPEVLCELKDRLKEDSLIFRELDEAIQILGEDTDESAERAAQMLWQTAGRLEKGDISVPFEAADLEAARQYYLVDIGDTDTFCTAVLEKGKAGKTSFTMLLPGPFWDSLQEPSLLKSSDPDREMDDLDDLLSCLGVQTYSYSRSDELGMTVFQNVVWYPGQAILWAWQAGRTQELGEDEKRTLETALAIAQGAVGDDLQRERQIHDELCRRITYYTNEESDFGRKDSAVGALLDGYADCDGYSDAFLLCCGLAGLEARYIHGNSLETNVDTPFTGEDLLHMWNLICVDGAWLGVDVTWDDKDSDNYISYCNFNIGAERMALSHMWNDNTVRTVLEPGTGNAFRGDDLWMYEIGSFEELPELMRTLSPNRPQTVRVIYPSVLNGLENADAFADAVYGAGIDHLGYYHQNAILELYDLNYYPEFAFIKDEQALLNYLADCRNRGASSCVMYCDADLFNRLSANDFSSFYDLIAQAGCLSDSIHYQQEYGQIQIDTLRFS